MEKPASIAFDKVSCTLLLHTEKPFSVPEYVEKKAQAENLERKQEVHITIFGFGTGQKISQAISGNQAKANELAELIDATDWSFEPKQEFYAVKRAYKIKGVPEDRETIVMMVKMPKLEEFIQSANRIVGLPLEIPPVHATLFSKSTIAENMQSGIGISSNEDFRKLEPEPLREERNGSYSYSMIALPTRPQPDTVIAIFILKQFGKEKFPGVETAEYSFIPRIEEGETEESMAEKGVFLFDVGGGIFDHHNKSVQTTASNLIAEYLGVRSNPALLKLLQFAERDDFYGKGTISIDPLDRAFGFSGLVGALNKKYVKEPGQVINIMMPIVEAFYAEEAKRAFEMPKEVEDKLKTGKAQSFNVRQRGKSLKCILIETDNTSIAGYLRSKGGGGFDVVAIKLSSGHVNILTRPLQQVDLRSLVVLIRVQEAESQGIELQGDPESLSIKGSIKEVPEWFYDPATNSLLNGGPNPEGVKPTSIAPFEMSKVIELGLSEQLWAPNR